MVIKAHSSDGRTFVKVVVADDGGQAADLTLGFEDDGVFRQGHIKLCNMDETVVKRLVIDTWDK